MTEHHWRHALTITRSRGLWKGTCICGWQSKRSAQIEWVTGAYKQHTKLIEREGRRASEGA